MFTLKQLQTKSNDVKQHKYSQRYNSLDFYSLKYSQSQKGKFDSLKIIEMICKMTPLYFSMAKNSINDRSNYIIILMFIVVRHV